MTTAKHFAYNDTLGSKRRRRWRGSNSRRGALDSRRRNISVRQRSLGFSFLFCKQSASQSRGVAYWRGVGDGVVGETAAMYVWQQQAINQLTVQKNCRKLLDIYGQRTQSLGVERKSGRTRGVP